MNIIDDAISTEATRKNVRLMFPVMIHWAKTGHNEHTYGDLAHAIGKSKFSGIGHALYCCYRSQTKYISRPRHCSWCLSMREVLCSHGRTEEHRM